MQHRSIPILLAILAIASALRAQPYVPGEVYWSTDGYIEYRCGEMPLVLGVPHGGAMQPAAIPDRTCPNAVWTLDANTVELGLAIDSSFMDAHGCRPHMIINHLHRRKLDANRALAEAACGDPIAGAAWEAFHGFINHAKVSIQQAHARGFFIDLHGHGHQVQRLELGYLLYDDELQLEDEVLNTMTFINYSSIRTLALDNLQGLTHAELLRGPIALGTLLASRGYPSVPSAQDPHPLPGQPYFSGGYNTAQHSSYNGGTIDGVQMECNMQGVRDTPVNRRRFADSLVVAMNEYLGAHYFGSFPECMATQMRNETTNGVSNHLVIREGWLFAEVDGMGSARLDIYDVSGRLVFRMPEIRGSQHVPMPALRPGVHVAVLHGHDQQHRRAFVIHP
jgi:hypothetical protein